MVLPLVEEAEREEDMMLRTFRRHRLEKRLRARLRATKSLLFAIGYSGNPEKYEPQVAFLREEFADIRRKLAKL
jgi:5'-3' exonuclease